MLRAIVTVMLASVLAGCGSLSSGMRGEGAGVLPAERFAEARDAAERLGEPEAGEASRRGALRERLWAFEQAVIRKVVRLEQSDDWAGAEALLERARKAAPDSPILQSAEKQFAERRAARETVLRAELAIHRGELLLKDTEAYERLQKVRRPGLVRWLERNTYENRRAKTAAELHRYGEMALERQDYYLARRCLSLANRLDGDEAIKEDLKHADRRIARLRQRVAGRQQPAVGSAPELESAAATFDELLENGRLRRARQLLQTMQRDYPDSERVGRRAARLQARLQEHVAEAIERGKALYSEGKVEQALGVWKQVRPLAPDNVELLSSISRAEKVLQNLRVLSAEQKDGHSS